ARIAELLKGICDNDPRSAGDLRSCAVGAIIQGQDHLPCLCGKPDCVGAVPAAPGSSSVVISVIADAAAVEAAQNLITAQDQEQQQKLTENGPQADAEPELIPEPDADAPAEDGPAVPNPPECVRDSGLALLPGVKILPIVALAEAIRGGAAIKALWLPGPDPEPQYRPSARLAAFVRARDLFCR
ncbi:DUF222 domain-containing protein, partial [Mycobacterium sp. NAZ190054]|uniref:DUF222 domain-containing protein n=1 Tax=Mycobacterium sp. NAZ190054 TaxID=1747766 RepID=UPI0012E3C7FE